MVEERRVGAGEAVCCRGARGAWRDAGVADRSIFGRIGRVAAV